MKKFLIHLLLIICYPLVILILIFLWTDPYKTLHEFSLQNYSDVNREYVSMELYLKNKDTYNYNSFVFGSSRCCGLNTYLWKHYLPDNAQQFLFQGWGETISGIYQKLDFLDKENVNIENALIVLDIPSSFNEKQNENTPLNLRHYKLSGMPKIEYYTVQFINFLKPSFIIESIQSKLSPRETYVGIDSISNDYNKNNIFTWEIKPEKDSLKYCSDKTRSVFLKQIEGNKVARISNPLIDETLKTVLMEISNILKTNKTNYKILISPAVCYTNDSINPKDLELLYQIFGQENVHNYSGENEYTTDIYGYSDPNHFGLSVGWDIINEIYSNKYHLNIDKE